MKALIIVCITAILVLFSGFLQHKKIGFWVSVIGLFVALICTCVDVFQPVYNLQNMLVFEQMDLVFIALTLLVTLLIFLFAQYGLHSHNNRTEDHLGLLLFSVCGAICMISSQHVVMLFLGIEILSIPLYVLAGSKRNDLSSAEAALKYFIMGAFATGIFLFGVTLVYGASAHFDYVGIKAAYSAIESTREGMGLIGILLICIGFLFKVSAAPFHFWSPDVYEGSPNTVTAYMANVVKIAGFAAFLKLFTDVFWSANAYWVPVLAAVSAFSMVLANITALKQWNVKRLLAYSSISHAGYMLMAFFTTYAVGVSGLAFYLLAYTMASIIVFAIFTIVSEQSENQGLDGFNGLGKSNPLMALLLSIAILSMSGIPPLAGFMGKYMLFSQAFARMPFVVVVAVLSSAISIFYYFKIIQLVYFSDKSNTSNIQFPSIIKAICIFCAIVLIAGIGILGFL